MCFFIVVVVECFFYGNMAILAESAEVPICCPHLTFMRGSQSEDRWFKEWVDLKGDEVNQLVLVAARY